MINDKMVEMVEGDWIDKYKPIAVPCGVPSGGWTDDDNNDTLFETYGSATLELQKHKSSNIWTLVEEDGVMFILEGHHLVNRVGYFVTEIPHNSLPHCIEVEQ